MDLEAPIRPAQSGIFSEMVAQSVSEHQSFCPLSIPENYSNRTKGKIEFKADFFTAPEGDLRSVHIRGPKIQIINIFFFPSEERALPVFAMEFVVFADKPIVGVIDLKALNTHPYAVQLWQEILEDAHDQFQDLEQGSDPPEWFTECRSGKDFFVRPVDISQMVRMKAAHSSIWRRLSQAFEQSPSLSSEEQTEHAIAIQGYKDHHRENSPGLPFLNRTFGPEWTEEFLSNFLFK